MAEMLRIVNNIGTPVALLAVVFVLIFFGYGQYLKSQEKKLALLPPDERAKAVDNYLTRYKVDGGNFTREEKFQLLLKEMETRSKLSHSRSTIAAIVFLICFLAAVLAYVLRPSSPAVSALPTNTSLQLRMEERGMMTASDQRLGSHFAFTLSNPTSGLAIVDSLELDVIDVIEDPWPVAEARIATYKYELTLNPTERGLRRFASGEFKYAPGEVDRIALNVFSNTEGYDYFVRVVVNWYDAVTKAQRKTTSDVMVARFPKSGPGGDPSKTEQHKQRIRDHRDFLQSKQGAD